MTDIEFIKARCGLVNTDIVTGWEAGLGPKKKIGGRGYTTPCPPTI